MVDGVSIYSYLHSANAESRESRESMAFLLLAPECEQIKLRPTEFIRCEEIEGDSMEEL